MVSNVLPVLSFESFPYHLGESLVIYIVTLEIMWSFKSSLFEPYSTYTITEKTNFFMWATESHVETGEGVFSVSGASVCFRLSESLSFRSNKLNLIGCVKSCDIRIIWHHSTYSTRPNASTSLFMAVKASMASTHNSRSVVKKLDLIFINSTINGFDPELP